MFGKKLKNNLLYLPFILVCVFLDQWTKWLVIRHVKGTDGISVIPGVFKLYYHENTGAAFGILQNRSGFFMFIVTILLLIIGYLFLKIPYGKKFVPLKIVFSMVMAGAIGNLADRIVHGFVVDFLYFELINFPIFNLADTFVTISAVLLFLLIMFRYKDEDLEFFKRNKRNGEA